MVAHPPAIEAEDIAESPDRPAARRATPTPATQGARVEADRKEKTVMATQTETVTGPEQDQTIEEKIQQLRELYADAPEMGRVAAEHLLSALQSEVAARTDAASPARALALLRQTAG
jgi:predicted  nucleic acid-binding Zn-ribbon protein